MSNQVCAISDRNNVALCAKSALFLFYSLLGDFVVGGVADVIQSLELISTQEMPHKHIKELSCLTLTWHVSKYKVHKLHQEDVPLVESMYFVFMHMPGESYCR